MIGRHPRAAGHLATPALDVVPDSSADSAPLPVAPPPVAPERATPALAATHLRHGDEADRQAWRTILLRGCILRATEADLDLWLGDDRSVMPSVTERLREALDRVTAHVAAVPDDAPPGGLGPVAEQADLDERLTACTRALARVVADAGPDELDPLHRERLLGTLEEAPVVDVVADLAARAEATARAAYPAEWPDPPLVVNRLTEDPHGPGDPRWSAFTATTGEAGERRVHLAFWPEWFGPETYAALPYLFLREYLSGVTAAVEPPPGTPESYERLFLDRGPRLAVAADSEFSAGLLDWVAVRRLEAEAERFSAAAPAQRAFVAHAAALAARADGADPLGGRRRQYGHEAATGLVTWWQQDGRYRPADAQALVTELAYAINLAERELEIKDRLVIHLHRLHSGFPLGAAVEQGLRRWGRRRLGPEQLLDLIEEAAREGVPG